MTTRSSNDRFEVLASLFAYDKGMLAPGKDAGRTNVGPDYEERMEAWQDWVANTLTIDYLLDVIIYRDERITHLRNQLDEVQP